MTLAVQRHGAMTRCNDTACRGRTLRGFVYASFSSFVVLALVERGRGRLEI